MTDVTKLRAENITRAYEYLSTYKSTLDGTEIAKINPAAEKIVEWVDCILALFKYKCGKNQKAGTTMLPKVKQNAMESTLGRSNNNLVLKGMQKQVAHAREQKTKQRKTQFELESVYYASEYSNNSSPKQPGVVCRSIGDKKKLTKKGRYVTGKMFALTGAAQLQQKEIPLAILKGLGKQRAYIMKAIGEDGSNSNSVAHVTNAASEGYAKDSEQLGDALDKFAEP